MIDFSNPILIYGALGVLALIILIIAISTFRRKKKKANCTSCEPVDSEYKVVDSDSQKTSPRPHVEQVLKIVKNGTTYDYKTVVKKSAYHKRVDDLELDDYNYFYLDNILIINDPLRSLLYALVLDDMFYYNEDDDPIYAEMLGPVDIEHLTSGGEPDIMDLEQDIEVAEAIDKIEEEVSQFPKAINAEDVVVVEEKIMEPIYPEPFTEKVNEVVIEEPERAAEPEHKAAAPVYEPEEPRSYGGGGDDSSSFDSSDSGSDD